MIHGYKLNEQKEEEESGTPEDYVEVARRGSTRFQSEVRLIKSPEVIPTRSFQSTESIRKPRAGAEAGRRQWLYTANALGG